MEIEYTNDGSKTLYVPEIDEHYHSVKGAMTESLHIFIGLGLKHCEAEYPRVLEVGFGTGLNAWLTRQYALEVKKEIKYVSLEKYPISYDLAQQMIGDNPEWLELHQLTWEEEHVLEKFRFRKLQVDFTKIKIESKYDVIFFDAFSPEKQPEMWSEATFLKLYDCLNDGGVLTTYCAKGAIRRLLQSIGFVVERLPGPPNGKREVLRATKYLREFY